MRTSALATLGIAAVVALAAPALRAGTIDGTVKLGGVILSDEGDRSTVQETYNIHDGFALSQIRLHGTLDPRQVFALDLREMNRDSRQGDLAYRVPGIFKLTAGYGQSRQVFDPARVFTTDRKHWKVGAQVTPARWLSLTGGAGQITRAGERLSFPLGTESVLGEGVDSRLTTGEVTASVRMDRYGGAVTYRQSDFADDRNGLADRTGRVVSARLYGPWRFYDKWTHLLRGAYGVRELSNRDLDYTLAHLQYTGILEPIDAYQVRYAFEANRIDSKSTGLKTDWFRNDLDATVFYRYGRIGGGYGYETHDDDRSLTAAHRWRAGATYRFARVLNAKLDYAGRMRNDQEDLTLLKDVESSRIRGQLQVSLREGVALGGGFTRRLRQFPDIDVEADGKVATAFARLDAPRWGSLSTDYSHALDEVLDRAGRFETRSDMVTARVELTRLPAVRLAAGVTYLDIGRDLDLEKSIVFMEGGVKLLPGYRLEVKYNVYNYDDYLLLDRYYTANVLRIDVGYDFNLR
jgi:hypothetical protein